MDWSTIFYVAKCLLSIVGAVMIIEYTRRHWDEFESLGQRMRYITLLWAAMNIAYASVHQLEIGRAVEFTSVLALGWCLLLISTMWITYKDDSVVEKEHYVKTLEIDVEGLSVEVDAAEYHEDPAKVIDEVLAARAALRLPENHPTAAPYTDPEDAEVGS